MNHSAKEKTNKPGSHFKIPCISKHPMVTINNLQGVSKRSQAVCALGEVSSGSH